jgi:predicted nucleic acid-binding protein
MKLFLDANVLVSVLNQEYPLFSFSSRVLSLADNKKYQLYTSPVCLAIAFYFAEKKSGNVVAKKKIGLLAQKINIANHSKKDIAAIMSDKKILDFEDGLEYFAAVNEGCACIVTEDAHDFYFSKITVCGSQDFLMNHVFNKK